MPDGRPAFHLAQPHTPAPERLRDPNAVRAAQSGPPAGLPVFSTEKLNAAEREALRELRRRYELAAAHVADVLEIGTVANGMDTLTQIAADTDGLALRAAAKLGSGR